MSKPQCRFRNKSVFPSLERGMVMGVRKSKSFATPGSGQFECVLDEKEATEKKKTMMAFFAADIAAQRACLRPKTSSANSAGPTSAAAAARYVAATTQKRGSITRCRSNG